MTNRLKQAWQALFTRKPKPAAPDEPVNGVLFGLDLPEGCHFEVIANDEWWHVRIYRGKEEIAHKCERLAWCGGDDEATIVAAANKALEAVSRKQRAAELEGCYPPKWIAKGERRA